MFMLKKIIIKVIPLEIVTIRSGEEVDYKQLANYHKSNDIHI